MKTCIAPQIPQAPITPNYEQNTNSLFAAISRKTKQILMPEIKLQSNIYINNKKWEKAQFKLLQNLFYRLSVVEELEKLKMNDCYLHWISETEFILCDFR